MARKYRKFSPEFRDEAVRLVIEASRPIAQVARELGVNEGTLGNWVNQYRKEHAGDEPPLTPNERIQLAEAQRELRELRMENEFLDSCRTSNAKYAYPVKKMCAWLAVSASGFFDWRRRPDSATAQRRERL